MQSLPADIADLLAQFETTEREARDLAATLDERLGTWQPRPGSWSVAECLDHLAKGNRAYMDVMRGPIAAARRAKRQRRRPAVAGPFGGWLKRSLEPPVKSRMKAPRNIRPVTAPPLHEAIEGFVTSHREVRQMIEANADLDLAGILFRNPFIPILRFSLASGFHILAAHARRHLWQAQRVREAAARDPAAASAN